MAGSSRKKAESDWGSWVFIIFMLWVFWPIGLLLLFSKLFGKDGKQKPAGKAKSAVRKATKSPTAKASTAKWLKIGGIVVMALALLSNWDYLMWFLGGDTYWWEEVVQMIASLVAGGTMFFAGRGMSLSLKRYAKYLSVMGDRDAIAVEELARTLGYSERRVERDLQRMIDKGYFGGRAYLNVERGWLYRSGEADAAHRQAQEEQQTAQAETRYSAILNNISRANDAIADPELSTKIDRLEDITARIFRAVEEDPDKQEKIKTFLNYYMPTTQKLLDSYAQFEAAGVEGENLRQAKSRIEATMDSIIRGFEHQLDELYKADAMDVDADIRVMETMLRRDTATVAEDFDMGAAVQQMEE